MRRSGPIPLYYQVMQILRGRIASGDHLAGSQLPTDEALMTEFRVSRQTIRSAMQELVNEGLIERFPGRGTFVTKRDRSSSQWAIESLEELIETTTTHPFKVIEARFVPARTAPRVASLFHSPPEASVFHVRAVRSSEQGPYAYSNIYFPREIGEKLPQHLFSERPLILLVDEYAGVPVFEAQQVASAAPADREAARFLNIRFGDPVLVMERTYRDREGRPIEHARIQYRPDRYQQTVHFSRRQSMANPASQNVGGPGSSG